MDQYRIIIIITLFMIAFLSADNDKIEIEKKLITETVLNYADGFYSGDGVRMAKAIHPDFNKVVAVKLPETRNYFLSYSTYSQLIKLSSAGMGFLDKDKRNITVDILTSDSNSACVKMKSARFNDYLQIIKIDGEWKIINVLWMSVKEDSKQDNTENYDTTKEMITKTVSDFYKGIYSQDVTLIEKSIHPEFNSAVFSKISGTDEYAIQKRGRSFLIEIVRAKLNKDPVSIENIKILDIMDQMAFVEAISSNSINYLHLQNFNGKWEIINVLQKPT